MPLTLNSVSFIYPAQEKPVFEHLTLTFEKGWTGLVGAHKTGKTTLLHLVAGRLRPTTGVVKTPGQVVYCPRTVERSPEGLARVLAHRDGPSAELFGRLSLREDWLDRWDLLSPGERKRAQIACALLEAPEVLALDEPTTEVDGATRDCVAGALARYRGIGLLVSHDRELLDRLCRWCVIFEHGTITQRLGTYSQSREQANRELETRHRQQENAAKQHAALSAEAEKRRDAANSANDKRSKRNLDKHDSDGRFRLNLARRSGKDGKAGKLLKQLEGRLHQAETRVAELYVPKRPKLGMALLGEPSTRPVLLRTEPMELPLGEKQLKLPAIEISPHDRIGLSGPAGSGKSALVHDLLARLGFPPISVLHLPQEIESLAFGQRLQRLRALAAEQLQLLKDAISSLGADPERLLANDKPSQSDMRKLLFAGGLLAKPNLIVLDDPTRHMDLPAIEALQDCLAETRCALLLVSHDLLLLRRLCRIRWDVAPSPGGFVMSISESPAA